MDKFINHYFSHVVTCHAIMGKIVPCQFVAHSRLQIFLYFFHHSRDATSYLCESMKITSYIAWPRWCHRVVAPKHGILDLGLRMLSTRAF